jgi:DNA mismatch repair protein MutH
LYTTAIQQWWISYILGWHISSAVSPFISEECFKYLSKNIKTFFIDYLSNQVHIAYVAILDNISTTNIKSEAEKVRNQTEEIK